MSDLSKQYNKFSSDFAVLSSDINHKNRQAFYEQIDFDLSGKKLIDLGCGDGTDLKYYKNLGAEIYGADASEELISLAKQNNPEAIIENSLFEKLPFEDNFFDVVVSKYAIQTSREITPILKEIDRVLKSDGILIYLVTHPFRQFIEKKKEGKDYFKKEIVDSILFEGKITVQEPTHTMMEYLNKDFFSKFEMIDLCESFDFPAAEQIGQDIYPTFLIIKARKK